MNDIIDFVVRDNLIIALGISNVQLLVFAGQVDFFV